MRSLPAMATSLFFGTVVLRIGLYRAVLISQALESFALVLIPWASSTTMLFVLLAAQGAGLGFCPPAANVLVTDGTSVHDRAIGFACVGIVSRSSALVLPPFLGLLAEVAGISLVFVAGGLLAGLCVAVLAVLILRQKNGLGSLPHTGSQP